MAVAVRYHRHFKNQVRKLPRDVQVRVLAAVKEYAETGRGDVRRITGNLDRLRVGDYRVFQGLVGGELRVVGVFHRRFEYAGHVLRAALDRLKVIRE